MYCIHCGKELPENSKFCNHCGGSQQNEKDVTPHDNDGLEPKILLHSSKYRHKAVKNNNSDKKKPGCLLTGIAFCLFFVVIICFMASMDEAKKENGNNSNNSVAEFTTESPIEISVSKLVQAYIDNEVKADMTYDDKTVIVSGRVNRIEQTDYMFMENDLVIYVGTGDDIENCLRCYVSSEQKEIVAELEQGDKITIAGRCAGLGSSYFNLKCVNIYNGVISE